jgi:hypothetical protein
MTTLSPPPSPSPHAEPLFALACPGCHAALAADRESAGTPGRCPLCHAAFTLPVPPTKVAHEEPAPADRPDDDPQRRLREERSTRRARRNIVMLVSGVVILLAIVLLFGTRRPKKRRVS